MGIDEKSFQRRHGYVTVVNDRIGSRVLYVADDRKQESLEASWAMGLTDTQRAGIQGIAMDMMSEAFTESVVEEAAVRAGLEAGGRQVAHGPKIGPQFEEATEGEEVERSTRSPRRRWWRYCEIWFLQCARSWRSGAPRVYPPTRGSSPRC